MANSYDRRTFLANGAKTAAGVTVLGGVGGGLLTACGSSSGGGAGSVGGTGTATGRTSSKPQPGGSIVMGVESEVNSFNPSAGRFDPGGIIYARTVFDPLATYASDGSVHPYLAESITHNAAYTTWTVTARSNVKFHDGSPLDGAAMKANFDSLIKSGLTGPALANVANVAVGSNPMAIEFTMKTPWIPFDAYLTAQLGFVASPDWIKSGQASNPVGTGPFVFKDWVPNDHFTATKNQSYWRQGLPYLDQVTFKPIPDTQTLDNSLKSGTLQLAHSSNPDTIVAFKGDSGFELITDANNHVGEPDEDFIMLNTDNPPLDDVRVRQALAYATDKKKIIAILQDSLNTPSNGPFPPGTPWNADTGYPQHDPSKAKSLIQQYEKDKGPVRFQLGSTNTPKNLSRMQLLQQMWGPAGIQTTLTQVEQTQFILNALQGKYHAYLWRQFAAPDPDVNYVWWTIKDAAPIGSSALNFSRIKDQQLQDALDTGRTHSDPAVRNKAYQTVAKRFGALCPFIWNEKTLWTLAAKSGVENFNNGGTNPDGSTPLPMTGGEIFLTEIWVKH